MSLRNENASGFSSSCSCTSCFLKSASECPLEEYLYVRAYMNRLYYGTYLPLREQKVNELMKTLAECNALQTIYKSNTPLNLKVNGKKFSSQTRQFINTSTNNSEIDKLIDNNEHWYSKFNEFNDHNTRTDVNNEFARFNKIQQYAREADDSNARQGRGENIPNTGNTRLRRIARLQSKYQPEFKSRLVKSDPYTSPMIGTISKLQLGTQQFEMNREMNNMSKLLPNTYLQNIHHQISLHEICGKEVRGQSSTLESSQIYYSDGYSVAPMYSSKVISNLKVIHNTSETSVCVILLKEDYLNSCTRNLNSFNSVCGSYLLKPSANSLRSQSNTSYTVIFIPSYIDQRACYQETQINGQKKTLRRPQFDISPYAQMQAVYNVMEQTTSQMKEKGTSQQFKKRSQGIGTVSSSQPLTNSTNDSSTGTPKRRAIKIESSVSFSIEFFKKQKNTASDIPGHEETAAQKGTTKVKGSKKKSLHRCFCTMSFPTEGTKPEECAPGVCVPGECNPSECFKRIQQKSGKKKKKSASDVSSSQASQTRKTKAKEERAGKETLVKEKASSSISKYKESVEIKPAPEKEKVSFATYLTKCCEKLRCWQQGAKDKPIALKRAVTDTDIAGKTAGSPYGANVANQSGTKKGKATKDVKSKDSVKESKKEAKKGKKIETKEATGKGEGDKKVTGKKGKKVTEKESKGPAVAETKKVPSKKGKKPAGKEVKEAKAPEGELKKAAGKKSKKVKGKEIKDTAGKGDETKASGKKGKKATGKEVKKAPEEKVKKSTKKEKKKGRPLKPYECEPGVCYPKVCSPQECYERKFPPPPKEVVVLTPMNKLQNLLRRCCCRPVLGEGKKVGVSSDAATQSRKAAGPEKTPGVTVYKEKGSSGPKKLKSGSTKYPQMSEGPPELYDQPTPVVKGRKSGRDQGPPKVDVGVPPPTPMESGKAKGRERRIDTGVPQYTDGGDYDVPVETRNYRKQRAFSGVQYYQNVDNELKTKRQGVNIGSECSCSVEFYKMIF